MALTQVLGSYSSMEEGRRQGWEEQLRWDHGGPWEPDWGTRILSWGQWGAEEGSWAAEWLGSLGKINLVMVHAVSWMEGEEWEPRGIQEGGAIIQEGMMVPWRETLTTSPAQRTPNCPLGGPLLGPVHIPWCMSYRGAGLTVGSRDGHIP